MKMSKRALRMERQHKKYKTPALNLVALMDIFTVLVFFLLVNTSGTQQLPSNKDLKLPSSVSQNVPEDTLTIAVTERDILIQGVSIAKVEEVLAAPEEIIHKLKEELTFLSGQGSGSQRNAADVEQRSVMIMGDENISYELIRKILTTCQEANYTKIAFAATQVAKSKI